MDTLNYLLLVNIYLILFYAFYALFLKNETFFKLNRIYLVGGACMSFLIPFLQSEWIRSLFITKQVEEVTQNITLTFSSQPLVIQAEETTWETGEIILFIYLAGAALCLLRFLWQLYRVQAVLKTSETDHAYSFFSKVKVGTAVPNRDTVLDHEMVHARQWHSADVILFEIISIVNWFNPVVYLYRKAIKHIHEFTADEIAAHKEESKAAYAVLLLSKTFGISTHQLTNSFYNQSLLKRRIIMLHKSKSTRNALLKYGLSAPLFAGMMILSSASFKSEKVAEKIGDISFEALDRIQSNDTTESEYERFLKRNPTIEGLEWRSASQVYVILKNGKKQSYELNNAADLKKAQNLYGTFPMPPPPPPPVPMSEQKRLQVSQGEDGQVFTGVEVTPEFVGGMEAFYRYLGRNFKLTESARAKNLSGKIILQFVVETNGALSEIRILRGLGSGLDEEAVRVLAQSPEWKPGMQNGKPVRVAYTLPISINIHEPKTGSVIQEQKTGSIGVTMRDGKLSIAGANDQVLYVVDGKKVQASTVSGINANSVKAVNVLKGESATAKYGEQGKDGVVEVYVNVTPPAAVKGSTNVGQSVTVVGQPLEKKILQLDEVVVNGLGLASNATQEKTSNNFHGLVVIDGKEASNDDGKALSRIKPNDIEGLIVLKDGSAIKAYGERGKNGVIEITLKN